MNLKCWNFKFTEAEIGNEALKTQKSPQHDCCGQNGAMRDCGGAAHPEEAAKMAGRKECVPTGYNIVLGDREIMRRTCT